MTNTKQPYLEVADRMGALSTLIGKRDPIVAGQSIIDPGIGLQTHASELLKSAARLRKGTAFVAVVGGVSAGKTTLISAITGLPLPTGVDAKTGVLTEISHGHNPNAVDIFFADRTERMSMSEFRDFSSLPAGSIKSGTPFPLPSHLMTVSSARVESTSQLSQQGIILVDTLGFNAGALAAAASKDYLRSADLAILILGTRPPFTDKDVEFVMEQIADAQINDPKLRHLFVVLNDFALREDEKQEAWAAARVKLDGLIDEDNFNNQVFMVNAFKALEARQKNETAEIDATGLPKLERALETVLRGRRQVILESTTSRKIAPAIRAARTEITVRKALLQTSAEKVKSAVQAAQNALETSREKAKVLLSSFTAAGSFLTDTIIHNYNDYFHNQLTQEDWRTAWEQDGPKIGMVEFSLSVFGKKRRERLEKRLRTPIEKLIGGQLNAWSDQLPNALSEPLKKFDDFEGLAENFADSLVATDQKLIEGFGVNPAKLDVTRTKENSKRIVQIILGIVLSDPSQVVGAIYAPDWGAFVRRAVIEILAVVVAIALLGPLGILAVIAVMVAELLLNILMDQKNRKNRLAQSVADKIREQFIANSPQIIDHIRVKMNERLNSHADDLQEIFNKEIEERQTRLDERINAERRAAEHTDEKQRLQRVDTAITEEWKAISNIVYGKVINETEISESPEEADDPLFTHGA